MAASNRVQRGRPVYVLGAGFSAAISPAMPLTNDVGEAVKEAVSSAIDTSDLGELGFEDWLSVRVVPMPFLSGHENQLRLAAAQEAISVIAEVIEDGTTASAEQPVPVWLQQLISIWHVEKALVVTFNYDCLVERAVNDVRPTSVRGNEVDTSLADDVVFPSPPPPPVITYADYDSSIHDSFQLLKVHGSVNWYWNAGDTTGSSLARTRERSGFSGRAVGEPDYTGISLLDRFLIPPVASKVDYYTPPLTKILWRAAGDAVKDTGRVTLMGYSMPTTDRATIELLRRTPEDASVDVVDRYGDIEDGRGSVVSRASQLANFPRLWKGENCVEDYVKDRVRRMTDALSDSLAAESGADSTSVIVALPIGNNMFSGATLFALAMKDGVLRPVEITDSGVYRVGGGSPIEAALNSQAPGTYVIDDFVTMGHLRQLALQQQSIIVTHDDRKFVAITALRYNLRDVPVLELTLAPTT